MLGNAIRRMDKGSTRSSRVRSKWQELRPRKNPQSYGCHNRPIPDVGARLPKMRLQSQTPQAILKTLSGINCGRYSSQKASVRPKSTVKLNNRHKRYVNILTDSNEEHPKLSQPVTKDS